MFNAFYFYVLNLLCCLTMLFPSRVVLVFNFSDIWLCSVPFEDGI
jgi:hypothetical protein